MALHLTPTVLKQAYELLSATEPFNKWNLPEGDDVVFRVLRTKATAAQIKTERGKKPIIWISVGCNGHINTVLSSLAHEMIHLHEVRCKVRSRGRDQHSAAFRQWAKQVCDAHGYDLKIFY